MRRALVAGNWKMNGSKAMARALAEGIRGNTSAAMDTALCPPFPYLHLVGELIVGRGIELGAQNLAAEPPGAYTGEVAAEMLTDLGCSLVLVGHSERRQHYGEDDGVVATKFVRALEAGLTPVLCLGETLAEREAGDTEAVVARQLGAVLAACRDRSLGEAVVLAYEPVWAIGTGRTASPAQAQQVHAFLRRKLDEAGAPADAIRILYGGSVKADNAAELFAMADIDGGLIGGASLQVDEFLAICRAAGN